MSHVLKDKGAYARIYAWHRTALIDYATSIVGCRARAEDVVQEVYIRFATAGETGTVDNPISYLYRIVRNLSIDTFRRESRQMPGLIPDEMFAEIPSDTPSPERVLEGRRRLSDLEAAIAQLPERTRRIFILHRLQGRTYEEIADELGISKSTVQKHLTQALAHAMKKIND